MKFMKTGNILLLFEIIFFNLSFLCCELHLINIKCIKNICKTTFFFKFSVIRDKKKGGGSIEMLFSMLKFQHKHVSP